MWQKCLLQDPVIALIRSKSVESSQGSLYRERCSRGKRTAREEKRAVNVGKKK